MAWLQELSSHPFLGSFLCLLLALVVLVVRPLARRTRLTRDLDASLTLMMWGLLFGALSTSASALGWSTSVPYLNAVFVGALGIGIVRAALTLFVDLYLSQREGAVISAIFRDVASVIAYFLVIVGVLRSTLDINLASLVATSAVLTVIVGLALQDVLSNLFSGLVLELEAPFNPGDWVRIGAFEGTVEETGWRTTKIRTRVNELVTLPNALMSKEAVVNFSRPDLLYADMLRFDADCAAPPNVVKEAARAVLLAAPDVLRTPEPEIWLDRYGESGIGYVLRFWINNFAERDRIRSRILTNLWYALQRADVRIPFPVRDVFVHHVEPAAVSQDHSALVELLRHVPLLAPLDAEQLQRLAMRVHRHTFGTGETVVREHEPGDSFYVIERGAAEVTLGDDGLAKTLGRLQASDFFGEMSLLAGEARTATVRAVSDLAVLVIDREAFKDIISADPELLEPLSQIAARRHAAQEEYRRQRGTKPAPEAEAQHAQRLRERIKAFFRL
jgi:small-conductance mechanosensitive channel/CRP-like cAMP-binding protein